MKSAKENVAKKEAKGKTKAAAAPAKVSKPPNSSVSTKATAGTVAHTEVSSTYSPPCTRSQTERFERRQMEDHLAAPKPSKMPSDVGSGCSVLKAMENLNVSGGRLAPPKKDPGTMTKAAAEAPAVAAPTVKQRKEATQQKQATLPGGRGKQTRRKNNP